MRLASLMLVLCLALTAAPQSARAQSSNHWTTPHIVLASAATLSVLIDWAQTRQAMRQGWGEKNPILGSHPSNGRLATYNITAIAGMLGIGAILPARFRTVWFGAVLGIEAYTIAGNASLGLHVGL